MCVCVSLKYFTHFYKTITVVLSSRFFLPVLLKAGYCIFQYEPFNNFCFHLLPMNINHHLGFTKHLSKLLALVSCYTSVYPSKRFQSRPPPCSAPSARSQTSFNDRFWLSARSTLFSSAIQNKVPFYGALLGSENGAFFKGPLWRYDCGKHAHTPCVPRVNVLTMYDFSRTNPIRTQFSVHFSPVCVCFFSIFFCIFQRDIQILYRAAINRCRNWKS